MSTRLALAVVALGMLLACNRAAPTITVEPTVTERVRSTPVTAEHVADTRPRVAVTGPEGDYVAAIRSALEAPVARTGIILDLAVDIAGDEPTGHRGTLVARAHVEAHWLVTATATAPATATDLEADVVAHIEYMNADAARVGARLAAVVQDELAKHRPR